MPNFDLALAPTLAMLLRERSVSRVARALGRSQTAISRELAALRAQLGDPLLVRTGGGMTLTPRGEQLLVELPDALAGLRRVVEGPVFDPYHATGTHRVSMSEYEAAIVLPRVLAVLDERAPRVRLAIVQRHRPTVEAALNSGEVALALGRFIRPGPLLHYQPLFHDDFVLIADRDRHARHRLNDLDYLLELPFVLIAPGNGGDVRGLLDERLDEIGRSRFVRLSSPHFATLPGLIKASRTVAFAPRRLLAALTLPPEVAVHPSPLPQSRFEIGMLWHQRTHGDASCTWLRNLIVETASDVGCGGGAQR